jgi:hypothetical protein
VLSKSDRTNRAIAVVHNLAAAATKAATIASVAAATAVKPIRGSQ